jgi:hypothetical protein
MLKSQKNTFPSLVPVLVFLRESLLAVTLSQQIESMLLFPYTWKVTGIRLMVLLCIAAILDEKTSRYRERSRVNRSESLKYMLSEVFAYVITCFCTRIPHEKLGPNRAWINALVIPLNQLPRMVKKYRGRRPYES